MAHVGVKGGRTHSSCPPGLPWVLTVCRLLHQPPVLTEVVCGFAQDAAHGVILEDREGRYGLSLAQRKEVCPAAQTPPVLDGGWGWGALRELGRSAPARLPLGRAPDFPVTASSIGSLHRAPRATLRPPRPPRLSTSIQPALEPPGPLPANCRLLFSLQI